MYNEREKEEIKRRLRTRAQKVLFRLWVAKLRNEVFFLDRIYHEEPISGGWLPLWALRGPLIGGDCADKRLRELRNDHLVPFKNTLINGHLQPWKIHRWVSREGKIDYLYCLDIDPRDLDWEEVLREGCKWVFRRDVAEQVSLGF